MASTMKRAIQKGDQIQIKPQCQDPGDDKFIGAALEDEDGRRVRIAPTSSGLTFPPNQVVDTNMVELAS